MNKISTSVIALSVCLASSPLHAGTGDPTFNELPADAVRVIAAQLPAKGVLHLRATDRQRKDFLTADQDSQSPKSLALNQMWKEFYKKSVAKGRPLPFTDADITNWLTLHKAKAVLVSLLKSYFNEHTLSAWLSRVEALLEQSMNDDHGVLSYFKGVLAESRGLNQAAYDLYHHALDKNHLLASARLSMGLGRENWVTRLGMLLGIEKNWAEFTIKSNLNLSKEERLAKLKKMASVGDLEAQKWVARVLYKGELGQGDRPVKERYAELKAMADAGTLAAQERVVEALYKGDLGQGDLSEEERYAELKAMADAGIPAAQNRVVEALYNGELGQGDLSEKERYAELKAMADAGTLAAQERVVKALYNGELGQGDLSEKERYAELKAMADAGIPAAQNRVVEDLSRLFYDSQGPRLVERVAQLKAMTAEGIRAAQNQLAEALYKGGLGQGHRPVEERLADLKAIANAGSPTAQECMVYAHCGGREMGLEGNFALALGLHHTYTLLNRLTGEKDEAINILSLVN